MQPFALPLCLAISLVPGLTAAEPQPKVPDAVADRFVSTPFENQKIGGLLGERMQINLEKRLLAIEEDAVLGPASGTAPANRTGLASTPASFSMPPSTLIASPTTRA